MSPTFIQPFSLVGAITVRMAYALGCLSVGLLSSVMVGSAHAAEDKSEDRLRGANEHYQQTLSKSAAALQASKIYRDFPHSRDDGYRFLMALQADTVPYITFFNSPEFPRLYWKGSVKNNWGFSNPDEHVMSVRIDDNFAYRIAGKVGSAGDIIITTYQGRHSDRTAGRSIQRKSMKVRRGKLDVVVSREKLKARNWLPMLEGADFLEIRQVFTDWKAQKPGDFGITRLDGEGESPPGSNNKQSIALVSEIENTLMRELNYWLQVSARFTWIPENYIAQARVSPTKLKDRWLSPGRYNLSDDKAMIITFDRPPGASYHSWALYNMWTAAADYVNRQTSLNHEQLRRDNDGRYRIVVSARDPQLPNWLDIGNKPSGYLAWQVTGENEPKQPLVRIVNFSELRQHLPIETAVTLPEQRISNIAERQKHHALRFGY